MCLGVLGSSEIKLDMDDPFWARGSPLEFVTRFNIILEEVSPLSIKNK